jgi:hypothetical protein
VRTRTKDKRARRHGPAGGSSADVIERCDRAHVQQVALLGTVTDDEFASHLDNFSDLENHYVEHLHGLRAAARWGRPLACHPGPARSFERQRDIPDGRQFLSEEPPQNAPKPRS